MPAAIATSRAPEVDTAGAWGHNARMAEAKSPETVKLVCGMISGRVDLFDLAAGRMAERLGAPELTSEIMDFDFTHYYDRQMGSPLYRRFTAFEFLAPPDALVEVKCWTNELEARFAAEIAAPSRPINLDPGYVAESKLVLASMKDFAHRLYLGRGVYGEVTLTYSKGPWEPLGWTFPDFASPRYHAFLTAVRDRLRKQTSGKNAREPRK